ncbi:MAG: isoprenylcysteine carboxylmethyltransferase family protein [Cyclobacteriaceae bacterium]|nr:isoprenylcysteine carboxylmethyltransferase family protein [Cyclobacteriaceae bacterium]
MLQSIYLLTILFFFILAFAVRNLKTYLATGRQSIKGESGKLTASIVLSTALYLLIAFRLIFNKPEWLLESNLFPGEVLLLPGLGFVTAGFVLGIFALIAMKNSWRVGIKYDQKTELVTSGIYRISRNPYFLSYDILIMGYLLLFPSPLLLVLYLPLVIVFHKMILEEERYLETVHGQDYLAYKKKTGRYF